MHKIIENAINGHKQALRIIESGHEKIEKIAGIFISVLNNGGKIIFMGNGGSAADAQHLAAELVGRFKKNRKPLPAIALSTNTSTITAIGNDFGFEDIFTRQIEALANKSDLVVGLSTSGKSQNIIKAVTKAKESGIKTIGLLGNDGGDLKDIVNLSVIVPLNDTPRIQEIHIMIGHIICEFVDDASI